MTVEVREDEEEKVGGGGGAVFISDSPGTSRDRESV